MEHAIMCTQCNAPLTPHQFARSIVCSYCGATIRLDESTVSAEKFREAFRVWNSPRNYQIPSWVSIGDHHWAIGKCIAQGERSDVYFGRRARWPTELAIIKILRDQQYADHLHNEWDVLQKLQQSEAPGADNFTRLIPVPILNGDITSGSHTGSRVSIFRWASGFLHNFEDVIQVYPSGIPPQASIWVWRRILEVLSLVHASGMAHGAILPAHLLIQENEHGVRLVGYTCAGQLGEKLRTISQSYKSFYPQSIHKTPKLTAQLDLVMSARCIAAILGGNPETGVLPATVPTKLAEIVNRIALSDSADGASGETWAIHAELEVISREVFGPAKFMPIEMPS
jgi:hypothetical protein